MSVDIQLSVDMHRSLELQLDVSGITAARRNTAVSKVTAKPSVEN